MYQSVKKVWERCVLQFNSNYFDIPGDNEQIEDRMQYMNGNRGRYKFSRIKWKNMVPETRTINHIKVMVIIMTGK